MNDLRIRVHPVLEPESPAEMVPFSFDGRTLTGRSGEMIAAALFANGVRVFRTMPKTGAGRGGFCFAGRCSDCQVMVDGAPNVMACVTPLRPGMRIETQIGVGTWGSGPDGGDR